MENVCKVIQISTDISAVIFESMVGKTTKGNHFPVRIQIFVHDKSPLKCDKSNVNIKKGGGRIKK